MKNKQLGIVAAIGAPFLMIDMFTSQYFDFLPPGFFTGVTGLFYISGWLAGMEGLRRIHDRGTRTFSIIIIRIVMITLIFADISNLWQIFSPAKTTLFYVLDMGWPVSNLLMLIVGWAVVREKKIRGWQKWVPVAMGLWFPVSVLMGRNETALYVGGLYSALAWMLFAVGIIKSGNVRPQEIAATDIHY